MAQQAMVRSDEQPTLKERLIRMKPAIAAALPKHVNVDRMARIALTTLYSTPRLRESTPASFLGSIIQASQLGLEVNTPLGHAYLVPFRDRRHGVTICQLIIGYQGFMDLARRSGNIRSIYAFAVYQGDEFSYSFGLEPTIKHVPVSEEHNPEKLTHVYAVSRLKDGEPVFTVLTRADVERYRARSRAKDDGPWVTDYEAMALKTAIRRLFRWLPKSAEMATAAAVDAVLESERDQLTAIDPEVVDLLQAHDVEMPVLEDAPPPAPPEADGRRIKMGKGKKDAQADEAPMRQMGEH
jgi:recombination protein RecT